MPYCPLLPNVSGEELADFLCPTLCYLSAAGPSPLALLSKPGAICAPSPCLHPGSPRALWKSHSASRTQQLAPAHSCTMTGKGLFRHWQLPRQHPPQPRSPRCRDARHGPGLPPKQRSPRQGPACKPGLCGLAAGRGQGSPQPARGPEGPPPFGDLPHLTQPTPLPGTFHPAPDSKTPPGTSCFAGGCISPA